VKINENIIDKITKVILAIFTCITIFLMAFIIQPEMYGDGREYMLMTESFQNHFSPQLLKDDIVKATEDYKFEFELNRDDGEYPFGFFTSNTDKTYSYHFWLYSLLVLPIKSILKIINSNQLRCFQIFNALIYIASLWYTYIKYKGSKQNKFFLIMLFMVNPALYYIVWTHTEVFTFSLVCISLVMYSNKEYEKAIFTVSVAAMQNQPIIFLGGMYFIDYFINKYNDEKRIKLKEYLFEMVKKGVFFIPFFSPLIFYYFNFGTFSLIASSGYVRFDGMINKVSSLFFDLNQGMLPFIPMVLLMYFYILFIGILKSKVKSILNITTIIVIMLFCSLQTNWNPGEAGIMRYNVWIIPILIYFIISLKGEVIYNIKNKIINNLIVISIILNGFIIIFTGSFKYRYSHVEFNPISKYVLNLAPELYNPQEEIFAERSLGHEDYSENDFPIIYLDHLGNVRKVLLNNDSINKLVDRLDCSSELIEKKIAKYKDKGNNYYINFRNEDIKLKKNFEVMENNRKFKVELIDDIHSIDFSKDSEYLIMARVWNLGQQTWYSKQDNEKNPIGLSYHWMNEDNNSVIWDGNRSYIEKNIYPNENIVIPLLILTPKDSGNYKLKLDIVQEYISWFSDVNSNNYTIDIKVE
jgi:hypothetical protein